MDRNNVNVDKYNPINSHWNACASDIHPGERYGEATRAPACCRDGGRLPHQSFGTMSGDITAGRYRRRYNHGRIQTPHRPLHDIVQADIALTRQTNGRIAADAAR